MLYRTLALYSFLNVAMLRSVSAQTPLPTTQTAVEVASVRPHQGPLNNLKGFSSSGPHLTLDQYTPIDLVLEAYGLQYYQLAWPPMPDSNITIYYDISAKAEGDSSPTRSDFRRSLQLLLAQRFHMQFHYETRQMPVYALTIGKTGSKLKPSAPDAPVSGLYGVRGRNQTIEMPRESMPALANDLHGTFFVRRPVIDQTGLAGTYNVQLEATPEFRIERDPQPEDLSLFTAVQEQLGLILKPTEAGITVLVVDHIDPLPSEN